MVNKIELSAEQLKEIRKSLRLTQKELAVQFGLKDYMIRDMERGKTKVSSPLSMLLIREFQINPDWVSRNAKDIFLKKESVFYSQEERTRKIPTRLSHGEQPYKATLSEAEKECLSLFKSLGADLQELYLARMKADVIQKRIEQKKTPL